MTPKMTLWALCLCLLAFSLPAAAADEPPALTAVQKAVAGEFSRIDAALQEAARSLGASGLTGPEARTALKTLCAKFDYAADCAAVDAKGTMVTLEPEAYRRFEGTSIARQPHVGFMLQHRKPVLSPVFKAVEGFSAVDAEYPVRDAQGRYVGSASLLFKPEALFARILSPILRGVPLDVWAMEKSGRVLYDADASQIGENVFSSPLYRPYPQLLRLTKRIANNRDGSGSYRYKVRGERRVAIKRASWKTAALYGAEWRLVAVHVDSAKAGRMSKKDVAAAKPESRLKALTANAGLIKALARADKRGALRLLGSFYETTPGLYAVEWLDAAGVTRFGYPGENSLTDYDHRRTDAAKDRQMLNVLEGKKAATFKSPLLEGGTGIFSFSPVWDGDRYLGMVYLIRLKP